CGAVRDQRRRSRIRQALAAQLAADRLDLAERHVENDRLSRRRQTLPVAVDAFDIVAAYKNARVRILPMSQRNACVSGASACCGDAGDDLVSHARASQRFHLFATAAED